MIVGRIFYKFNVTFSFKVVDARIDARSGNLMLAPPVEDGTGLGRPASSFDTSFDNAKQDSTHLDAKIV